MIKIFRPTTKTKIIFGIAGNMQLAPITLNPFSIFSVYKDIKNGINVNQSYGYIF